MPPHSQTILINNLANGGDGVGTLPDGRACFVPRSIPGEQLLVNVTKAKKHWTRASISSVQRPSPHRVQPSCHYFEQCGGCQFWHMTYDAEIEHKSNAAFETIRRIAHSNLPQPILHPASTHHHYRNRATFHIRNNTIGFFQPQSRDIVDIQTCLLLDPRIQRALDAIRAQLADHPSPSLRDTELFLETANQHQVVATAKAKSDSDYELLAVHAANLTSQATTYPPETPLPIIAGIRIQRNRNEFSDFGQTNVDAAEAIFAPPRNAVVQPERFRQSNRAMNATLVELVLHWISDFAPKRVLELFCGMGNFTFSVAELPFVTRLDAYDIDDDALAVARSLYTPSPDQVVTWHNSNLFEDVTFPTDEVDLMLLDPPRSGAKEVVESLKNVAFPIIYVACDPASLGRDLATLAEKGYRCARLEMVDMFPRTAHIETVALLVNEEGKR